jgi:Ca2+:H+ antiporter
MSMTNDTDNGTTIARKLAQYWMLVFVPIAIVIEHAGASAPVQFLIAAVAIVPIAHLLSHSTEHLSHYTGDAIGGLMNVMFGNLPELIICIVALKAGLHAMVAASLIGAIVFNLLLVSGLSFLLGGVRHHTMEFNVRAVRVYSTLMFLAVTSLVLPSIYEQTFGTGGAMIELEKLNVGLAVLLLVLYAFYLFFMIRTHPEEFASVAADEGGEHGAAWSLPVCIGVLVGSSVVAAVLSEILVGAVEGTGEALGLSTAFLGMVLLASVGGIAEGMSAITMARKGRFDLSVGISLGSCTLIALFVAPVVVLSSYFVGPEPFQLSFTPGGVALLFISVIIGAFVATGGSGNWYKGVQLLALYLMIALLLYFAPV